MLPTKLSILSFYARIFTVRRFRYAVIIVGVICIAWFIGGIVPTVVQCAPIEQVWIGDENRSCVNINQMFTAITISNLLTDVLVLCLPITTVWNLKLEVKTRVALVCIFLMGGLVCVCSLIRIITPTWVERDFTGAFHPAARCIE